MRSGWPSTTSVRLFRSISNADLFFMCHPLLGYIVAEGCGLPELFLSPRVYGLVAVGDEAGLAAVVVVVPEHGEDQDGPRERFPPGQGDVVEVAEDAAADLLGVAL